MNQFQTEPQVQEQGAVDGHQGAVGGQPPQGIPINPVGEHPPQGVPPVNPVNPPLNHANPENFPIVNEYNSFNLANITPPIVLYSRIRSVKYTLLSHNGSIGDKELESQIFFYNILF